MLRPSQRLKICQLFAFQQLTRQEKYIVTTAGFTLTSMVRRAIRIVRTPLGIQDCTERLGQLLKTIKTGVFVIFSYEVLKDDPGKDLLHPRSLREQISSVAEKPLRSQWQKSSYHQF